MTKTLNEQWREGTLPQGWYYVKTPCEEIKKLYCGDGESLELEDPETAGYYFFHRELNKGQVEVLSPVPSYEEFQSYEKCADMLIDVNKKWGKTIKERKKLEKKLEIATKALKELETKSDKFYGCNDWSLSEQLDFIKAKCQETLYQLKEMEGVK